MTPDPLWAALARAQGIRTDQIDRFTRKLVAHAAAPAASRSGELPRQIPTADEMLDELDAARCGAVSIAAILEVTIFNVWAERQARQAGHTWHAIGPEAFTRHYYGETAPERL